MLTTLLYKLFLFSCGIAVIVFIRFIYDSAVSKLLLRPIPGPKASSFIWGEEWKLYSRPPGQPYAEWHKRYGPVVKFRGAFGVRFPPTPLSLCNSHVFQHQVVSITDHRAISFILGENTYKFPKAKGVRAWFKATLGEGILWVEGRRHFFSVSGPVSLSTRQGGA
jgi:hypothetical protein